MLTNAQLRKHKRRQPAYFELAMVLFTFVVLLLLAAKSFGAGYTEHRAMMVSEPAAKPVHEVQAEVLRNSDGDTLTVRPVVIPIEIADSIPKDMKVRLIGIDAPERHQRFGPEAAAFLRDLTNGRTATVTYSETDRYGRVLGKVEVLGRDVSLELLKAGLAWHYLQYSDDPEYAAAEAKAKKAKLGIWSDRQRVAPWVFRKRPVKRLLGR